MSHPPRLLITAGPTHEPIDAVRAIVNRSSGRLGCALGDEAASRGWDVRVLLGPTPRRPSDPRVRVDPFMTTEDLAGLLDEHLAWCDVLVMAAAVADYRPADPDTAAKLRRRGTGLVLRLEPTPDLLARCSAGARPDQLLVGFALEPADSMIESARAKLARKGVHAVVANPLETMDSAAISATLVGAPGSGFAELERAPDSMTKDAFAAWLLDRVERARGGAAAGAPPHA